MKIPFIYIAIASMLVISCTKNVQIYDETTPDVRYSNAQKSELISSYAQMLAASLENTELRSTIKAEAQLKFDGDYDILTSKLGAITLKKPCVDVNGLMANSCVVTRATDGGFTGDLEDLLAEIQATFPNLQVSVPVHCEEWDTKNHIPLVAYLPYDFDDQVETEIEAFDVHGKSYMLSLDEEPDQPVVVVSVSERVMEDGSMKDDYIACNSCETVETKSVPYAPTDLSLIHGGPGQLELSWPEVNEAAKYYVYRKKEGESSYANLTQNGITNNFYLDNSVSAGQKYSYRVRSKNDDGMSGYSTAITTFASPRKDGAPLTIKRMYFTKSALKAVEKWASGAPEIRLRVVYGASNPAASVTTGRLEPPKRGDINETWWNKTVSISDWATSAMGTVLTFDWREEDWDDNAEFTITASVEKKTGNWEIATGGSIKISGDDGGDVIGSTLVYYWDAKDKIYDVSGFKWQFE